MISTSYTHKELKGDLKYLMLLSKNFPTIASASTEIINLKAILHLPKGTEHFLADIHGEAEAFQHVLKNASGTIRTKVDEIFGQTLRDSQKKELCTLIYYPYEKLRLIKKTETDMSEWYVVTLNKLVKVLDTVTSKYTRSKVRKSLPPKYEYIIQELLHESTVNPHKSAYISVIIDSIITTGSADEFIAAMCESIQRFVIDHLHIVGDVFDRGDGAHLIMDTLCDYHNFDFQWGNHDILWMGAAIGNTASMANLLRIAMRYGNLTTLEDGYAINLLPLARFAMEVYENDPCTEFQPKLLSTDKTYDDKSIELLSQMQKAISIIQFKLEHEIIERRKEFDMQDRNLLHRINFETGTITLPDGSEHKMKEMNFPTIDPKDPYKLTDDEAELIEKLTHSFLHSEKLKKHLNCLYSKGSMYLSINQNLLYHASIPLDEKGNFKKIKIQGKEYSGKRFMDKVDRLVRTAYFEKDDAEEKHFALDYMWYLWCGKDSPLFDKSGMTTFERYFIEDKATHAEEKGYYFQFQNKRETCEMILKEFGLEGPDTHIINGHVPVKAVKGEKPMRAGGKLIVIDGGFSRAYQSSTGIAGYTLIFNSQGIQLVQHEPFESAKAVIEKGSDIQSVTVIREFISDRMLVKDTDNGKILAEQVIELKKLLDAYRLGLIKERVA
ncbi:MAG TPA: fructose-1,6-bisphosphatase [Dysgonamonadaceae bacterium]|nr:fructose-1,6-bisphosphatase [Dysgonamonadaceae bacterium]HUI32388.1 fructose-1,6-bisphosphatase [Dysgonamonadaceae bacterium]